MADEYDVIYVDVQQDSSRVEQGEVKETSVLYWGRS